MNRIIWFERNRDKIFEFLRYCIVGAIAAGIHYGVYYILQLYIDVNVSYTVGYLVSLCCNFFMTSYITFKIAPSVKKAFGFVAGHLLNYSLHMGLFNLYLFLGVSHETAPLFTLLVVVPTNFLVLRFIFRYRHKPVATGQS